MNKTLMPEKIKGLFGNHLFQAAAMIGTGERWSLPPQWETPLEGTLAPDALLVDAATCPTIWNGAPYLRGPIPMRERTGDEATFPQGSYLNEKHWAGREHEVKSALGYGDATRSNAAAFIGDTETAVAIHMRRGEKKKLSAIYGYPFEVSYILECMRRLPVGLRVFAFSDEPAWAIRCLKSIGIEAQDGEQGVIHPAQAMARMSRCRYMIGANSTLSWWAGYLNENPRKQIFIPAWRRLDYSNGNEMGEDWIPKSERERWTAIATRRTVAIIIAAHKASAFIGDCLQGFKCQRPAPGWDVQIRIGCDGCEDTKATLAEMGVDFYHSPENVGAYIMRNSLIGIAPADAYAIFDADDVPMPDFIKRSVESLPETGICTCARQETGMHLESVGIAPYNRCYGRAMFHAEAWAAAGSFRPDRCESDGDFVARLKDQGYGVTHTLPPFLMLRRQHPNQLTRASATKLKGQFRNELQEKFIEMRKAGQYHVAPVCTPLDRIAGNWDKIPAQFPDAPVLPAPARPATVDAVILYRKPCGDELKHTVAALDRYANGLRTVWIVGDRTAIKGVEHIACDDPSEHREANMIRKVLKACADPRISDPFLLCSDDEVLIRDVDITALPLPRSERNGGTPIYEARINSTRARIEELCLPWGYYDGHTPLLIEKAMYREIMGFMDWRSGGVLCRTPYACYSVARGADYEWVADAKHSGAGSLQEARARGMWVISDRRVSKAANGAKPIKKRVGRRGDRL